jgi:hypothetical protein
MKYPREYFAHRLDYMHTLLWPQTTFTFEPNHESFEFGFSENESFNLVKRVMIFVRLHFPLYFLLTDAFWMALSAGVLVIVLVLYLFRPRGYYRSLLVTSSAAFYAVPLAVIGPGGDYRYVYWAAGATCFAALLAPQERLVSDRA